MGLEDKKGRISTYLWVFLFPPYGMYRIWGGETTFRRSEKWVWTMIMLGYLFYLIKPMITG